MPPTTDPASGSMLCVDADGFSPCSLCLWGSFVWELGWWKVAKKRMGWAKLFTWWGCSTWNTPADYMGDAGEPVDATGIRSGVMEAKPRLGRGLTALLGDSHDNTGDIDGEVGSQHILPLDRIQRNPYQPRRHFDDGELERLTESIKTQGVLQPLLVRPSGEQFELIAGERRLRAAQIAGLSEVPVQIVNFNDQQVLEAALVENIQRSDLNPIEKAQGFKEYLDRYGATQEQLASRLGMDRTSVSNLVNLLHLPDEVQNAVRLEQITLGHAKILKGVPTVEEQVALCKEVTLKGLSVKALELLLKERKASAPTPEEKPERTNTKVEKTQHVQNLENELRQKFATKLEIKLKEKDKGQIVIAFETNDDFERVIEFLRRAA